MENKKETKQNMLDSNFHKKRMQLLENYESLADENPEILESCANLINEQNPILTLTPRKRIKLVTEILNFYKEKGNWQNFINNNVAFIFKDEISASICIWDRQPNCEDVLRLNNRGLLGLQVETDNFEEKYFFLHQAIRAMLVDKEIFNYLLKRIEPKTKGQVSRIKGIDIKDRIELANKQLDKAINSIDANSMN